MWVWTKVKTANIQGSLAGAGAGHKYWPIYQETPMAFRPPDDRTILMRLREQSEWYSDGHGPLHKEAADEIERLRASQERLKSAIEFAHSEGFQWPSDPMAEFANAAQET